MRIETTTAFLEEAAKGATFHLKNEEIHSRSGLGALWQRCLDLFRGRSAVARREADVARALTELLRFDNRRSGPFNLTVALPDRAAETADVSPRQRLGETRRALFRQCVLTAVNRMARAADVPGASGPLPGELAVLARLLPDALAVSPVLGNTPVSAMPGLASSLLGGLLADCEAGALCNLHTRYVREDLDVQARFLGDELSHTFRRALGLGTGFSYQGLHAACLEHAAAHPPTLEGVPALVRAGDRYRITAASPERITGLALQLLVRDYGRSSAERAALSWLLGPGVGACVERLLNGRDLPPGVGCVNPFNQEESTPDKPVLVCLDEDDAWCDVARDADDALRLTYTIPVSARGPVGRMAAPAGRRGEELLLEADPGATTESGERPGRMGVLTFTAQVSDEGLTLVGRPDRAFPHGLDRGEPLIRVENMRLRMDAEAPLRLRRAEARETTDAALPRNGEERRWLERVEDVVFAPIYW